MEKRLLLAVVLMTAAIMITNVLFPPPSPPPAVDDLVGSDSAAPAAAPVATAAPDLPGVRASVPAGAPDTVVVASPLYRYAFSTRGAALERAELVEYPSYVVEGEPVQIVPPEAQFLRYSLVVGGDTVDLSQLPFQPSVPALDLPAGGASVDFSYADPSGFGVVIRYSFDPGLYVVEVSGRVQGVAASGAQLLATLGPRMEVHEDPDVRSEREFAVVRRVPGSFDRVPFRDIEGAQAVGTGLTWAGIKDKYFLAAIIAGEETPLANTIVRDLPDDVQQVDGEEVELPQVEVITVLPVQADGTFSFSTYLGPQDYERLAAIGFDLEEVTPYGYRWLQPIIRPFAALVLWVLNGLHDTLGVAYGWVLVIFGVMMRIVLWPLNAKAMRSQMKNMAVQPLMQEIREKHKSDPQKQQEALLALYKEHGFNPFGGCLPLLVPFPVLITLFFVFQNTIAFRGAEFLWLPDLSLRDPLYILPMILVVSMFGLQWVSAHLSGMEQNPQMKMMMYIMPVMMGAIFFMLPAGLNLYYAVNQVASIPQQVLIAKERRRAQEELKKSGPPKLSTGGGGGGARTRSKARKR